MFVTRHQQKPLPIGEKTEAANELLPPIAPPYASAAYHFDPDFIPPQRRVYTAEEIEDFTAFAAAVRQSWFPSNHEFLVDL
jgi:hypothetical protein